MSPLASAETALALVAIAAPAALLATGEPETALQILPVSAGLSGAIVAALKAQLTGTGGTPSDRFRALLRFVGTVGSGATATVFGSPAAVWMLGVSAVPVAMLIYFVVGLLGSAICDAVLAAGPSVGPWLVEAGKRAIGIPSSPKPPQPKPEDKA